MEGLLNQMRMQARSALNNIALSKLGTIVNYDPQNYTAKVQIQPVDPENPDLSLTGYLPIFTPWAGPGWGMFAPPTPGDICSVHFQDNDFSAAFIMLRGFNNDIRPLPVDSGELWFVHASGSSIKLMNDGTIEIKSDGTINIDGASAVNLGNIGAGGLEALLTKAAATLYNSHTHTVSGGSTSIPIQQMNASHETLYTEAN